MNARIKHRLINIGLPVGAVLLLSVLQGRAAAFAAVGIGAALLVTSAVLLIQARRDRD